MFLTNCIWYYNSYFLARLNPHVGDSILFEVTKLEHDGMGVLSITGKLERYTCNRTKNFRCRCLCAGHLGSPDYVPGLLRARTFRRQK